MRAIWTGAIGFGLVNIPVRLFSATESSDLDLSMLDKKDHAKIRFKRVNEETGKEVAWENIVKGYDYEGKYIILTDEDFEKASAEKSKIIEINDFVNEDEIDGIYFEMPYFLVPDKSGERAYALLKEALLKTGKAGMATFVLRNKQSPAILRVYENVILLHRLRFAEEVRGTKEFDLPARNTIKPGELKMAISLINQLTDKFNIAKYKDTYTDQLMKVIKLKAKGSKLPAPKHMKVVHSTARDLMSQLKESLGSKRKKAS